MSEWSAARLSHLLADRHTKDVFVPECKMGSAGSRVLDGWALLPTWSPLTTIGYEIKVSRSDWLQDQKFEAYRACCHLFFIVAPTKIVAATELPPGVGLVEPIGKGTGARLVMRVKATRQEPVHLQLVRLMSHVLMWRKDERDVLGVGSRERRAAFWRSWVEEQKDFQSIGRSVRGRMRQMLSDAIDARRVAESTATNLADAKAMLTELGVTPGRWNTRRDIEAALRRDGQHTVADLNSTIERLSAVRGRVEQAMQRASPSED